MNPEMAPSLKMVQPFTPFPSVLIDEIMPTLKDTEWRLLCVIARQTLGWSEGKGKRKSRDWLSQKQLIARTGRNSAALSTAIDGLVGRNLIETRNEMGELLLTPSQRRSHQSRIYYGLCPETLDRLLTPSLKTALQKANRTKETKNKRNINKEVGREPDHFLDRTVRPQTVLRLYTGWEKVGPIAETHRQNLDCKGDC